MKLPFVRRQGAADSLFSGKEEKRVLHLRSTGGFLGAENVIIEIGKFSEKFGYRSIVASFEEPNGEHEELIAAAAKNGLETAVIKCRGRFDPSVFGRLRRVVDSMGIDVIHCHGYKEDFYALFSGLRIPKIATNHLWKKTTLKLRVSEYADSLALRYFDRVVAVSHEILLEMEKRGIPASKMSMIENGVDPGRFRGIDGNGKNKGIREQFGIDKDHIVLGTVSSLTTEKGHSCLLKAVSSLVLKEGLALKEGAVKTGKKGGIRLLIVGDGPEKERLKLEAAELGLSGSVIFAGKRKDIPELLDAMDIFIIPSFREGLPMALLEAMAASKTVIATDVGEARRVLSDGQDGYLVPPGNPEALCRAILEAIKDKDGSREMGRSALRAVEKNFTSEKMAGRYCALYDTLLASK